MTDAAQNLLDASAQHDLGRANLHQRIREAHTAGMTLRAIADIVGLSVETVRKITMKEG